MTAGERNARAALRASMAINGDPFKPKQEGVMPEKRATYESEARLPRVTVDFKIPLWGLASGATVMLWGLVSMYFQLANLSAQMADMQSILKANNQAMVQLASEQALLKYRIEKLEAAK